MKFTNERNIGLSQAVFLAHDEYDYDPRENSISATGLLKSTRQTILSKRLKATTTEMDISQLVASSLGTAVHDGIEKSWLNGNYKRAMFKLGYPKKQIDRIVVNPGYYQDNQGRWIKDPEAEPLPKNAIPVYMEIRSEKELDGVIITGKFDFIGDGFLEDHKTTGVYTYIKKTNDEKYRLQGSIYRWLNPDLVTSDRMLINYTFTDWSKLNAMTQEKRGYPQFRVLSVPFTLMTIKETEEFIRNRISQIKTFLKRDEAAIPLCTEEELWQDPTSYKYYKNPDSKIRSTKNFDNFAEAQTRLIKDGGVGTIDIVPGKAKACLYCPAAPLCSQAKQLSIDGLLDMEF